MKLSRREIRSRADQDWGEGDFSWLGDLSGGSVRFMGTSYRPREEWANTLTHGLGVVLSVAGLVAMVVKSAQYGDGWQITSTAIFGVTLVLLYTASTAYHAAKTDRMKLLLRKCDHAAIFLLIAGSYTPFVLVTLRGPWGWSLFGVVWGLAVVGVGLKFWFAGRFRYVSTGIYLGMGWLVVIAIKPLLAALSKAGFIWLLVGGGCYTFGAAFYLWKRLRYHHAIWHGWVLAGSVCQWIAVYGYVIGVG